MSTSKIYTLNVTETGNKSGKFHYVVTDEAGNVISERRSNREYVACTRGGAMYFGRLDLIGKGDHGRYIKAATEQNDAEWLEALTSIAYKK